MFLSWNTLCDVKMKLSILTARVHIMQNFESKLAFEQMLLRHPNKVTISLVVW